MYKQCKCIFQEVFYMVKRTFDKSYYWIVRYYIENERKCFCVTPMELLGVDYECKELDFVFWDDIIGNFYSFEDYHHLIFESEDTATKISKLLPQSGTILYQVIDKKIYKVVVIDIEDIYNNESVYTLGIRLNNGALVPVREMNKSLFFSKSRAKKFIKKYSN